MFGSAAGRRTRTGRNKHLGPVRLWDTFARAIQGSGIFTIGRPRTTWNVVWDAGQVTCTRCSEEHMDRVSLGHRETGLAAHQDGVCPARGEAKTGTVYLRLDRGERVPGCGINPHRDAEV